MKIRKIKDTEFEDFYSLKIEGIKYFRKISGEKIPTTKAKLKKEFAKRINDKEVFLYFLENKKKIIGYIDFNIWKKMHTPTSYLNDLVIKKEFRRKGYGKKLTKWFISFSKKKGVKRIGLGTRVENKKALKLYKKLGFEIIGYNLGMKVK
ncbi:GNAT family N-acetyltransferase [Candidatus Pacearchaeota archaeon]|nr:GNAT family N-acetyltransferase [Candidatus Pacearchaeota archaeon]